MQLLKDILFPATTEIKRTLSMCDFMLAHLKVNTDILDERKYDYLFTVEDVNRLVLAGVPFREAYKQVGMAVQRGEYHPTREVHHTHEGSIGNLCTAQIRRKMERVMTEFEYRAHRPIRPGQKGLSGKSDFNDFTPARAYSDRGDFRFSGLVKQPSGTLPAYLMRS